MGAVDVHFNFLYILSLTSHALIGFSLSLSLSHIFYIITTDAINKCTSNPSKSKFQLSGLVFKSSVAHPPFLSHHGVCRH